MDKVLRVRDYIQAGDVFQLVLSHRMERRTYADPFEVYRALRIVNPSPYMAYLQVQLAPLHWRGYVCVFAPFTLHT